MRIGENFVEPFCGICWRIKARTLGLSLFCKIWLTYNIAIEILKSLTTCREAITISNSIDNRIVSNFKFVALKNDNFTISSGVIVFRATSKIECNQSIFGYV